MATAPPTIGTPRLPSDGLGQGFMRAGAGLRRSTQRRKELEERKRKEREKERAAFQKMQLNSELDRTMRAVSLEAGPDANPVQRMEAMQRGFESLYAGYADADPVAAEQVQKRYEEKWAKPALANANRWNDERREEDLRGRFANTLHESRLSEADALRRAVDPNATQEQRDAAFGEYLVLTEDTTEYVRIMDPEIAGEQLRERNEQAPIDAMDVITNTYAKNGMLTQLQSEIRAGGYSQFRDLMTPDVRAARDEALSKRIAQEEVKRVRVREAQEADERALQDGLVEKFGPLATFLPAPQLKAQVIAAGGTYATYQKILGLGLDVADKEAEVVKLRSEGGKRQSFNAWADGLVLSSNDEVLQARAALDKAHRDGLLPEGGYEQGEAEIDRQEDRLDAVGEETMGRVSRAASRWRMQIGIAGSPDDYDTAQNLRSANFSALTDSITDIAASLGGRATDEVIDALYSYGVAALVLRGHGALNLDQSNLAAGVTFEDPAGSPERANEEAQWLRSHMERHHRWLTDTGSLEGVSLRDVVSFVAEGFPANTNGTPQNVVVYMGYDENGEYDAVATGHNIRTDPTLSALERANSMMQADELANVARMAKGMPSMPTLTKIREESGNLVAIKDAEQRLAQAEAEEAAAEAEEVAAPRRRRQQRFGGATPRPSQPWAPRREVQPHELQPHDPQDWARRMEESRQRRKARLEETPEKEALRSRGVQGRRERRRRRRQ